MQGTTGVKVILIMDTINSINSYPNILDYLYAHEIAHSAQRGTPEGGINDDRDRNVANGPVIACNEVVSNYGLSAKWENNADAISYYMTRGEEGRNYRTYNTTPPYDLKVNHPCTYNALKNGFFAQGPNGGPIEYDQN
jgi:hypothetical protein